MDLRDKQICLELTLGNLVRENMKRLFSLVGMLGLLNVGHALLSGCSQWGAKQLPSGCHPCSTEHYEQDGSGCFKP